MIPVAAILLTVVRLYLVCRTIQAHRSQFCELQTEFEKIRDHLSEANQRVQTLIQSEEECRNTIEVQQLPLRLIGAECGAAYGFNLSVV